MLNASKMLQSRLRGSDILRLPVSSLSSNSMFHRLPLLPQNVSTPALNPYPQLGWSSNRLGKSPVSHLLPLFGVTSYPWAGGEVPPEEAEAEEGEQVAWAVAAKMLSWAAQRSWNRLTVHVAETTSRRTKRENLLRTCEYLDSLWEMIWIIRPKPYVHNGADKYNGHLAIWWNYCGGQQLIGSLVYYTMNIIYYNILYVWTWYYVYYIRITYT